MRNISVNGYKQNVNGILWRKGKWGGHHLLSPLLFFREDEWPPIEGAINASGGCEWWSLLRLRSISEWVQLETAANELKAAKALRHHPSTCRATCGATFTLTAPPAATDSPSQQQSCIYYEYLWCSSERLQQAFAFKWDVQVTVASDEVSQMILLLWVIWTWR